MTLELSTLLNLPADLAWQLAKQSRTLRFVARGLLGFSSDEFPAQWRAGETVKTRLWLFNIVPAWRHTLRFVRVDDGRRELETQEQGGVISVWNHTITIEPKTDDRCLYTDKIEIEAGRLTYPVWLFAHIFYRYRQRRWQTLAKNQI